MSNSVLFRHQTIDENSRVVSGALIHFRQGRAPGTVFTDKAMKIPGRNPLPANSRGVAVAYLPVGEEYEITITRSDGSFVEQFDHTALPASTERIIEQPAPEPEVIEKVVEKIVEVPVEVENTDRLDELESRLKAAQEALERRPETVVPEPEPAPEMPPEAIADLFDPSLTPRQNQDALLQKYREAKGKEEYARDGGDMQQAMIHLKEAERYESGINWNRAVHAEVLG